MNRIDQAVRLLRSGRLVAFPTETVYGLGADATDARAVRRVFEVKGRPATNPLIVHVADEPAARRYARHWPSAASKLAAAFWPGPLTLVLPKHQSIVPEATAGLDTVGLRAPDHPLALELLRTFNGPLVGPSANRSNRVSPTTAEHVRQDLGEAVDLILDGGPCRLGIESTVLDLSAPAPSILRLGGVSRDEIENLIGPVPLSSYNPPGATPPRSPGQQHLHYAPATPAFHFHGAPPRPVADARVAVILLGNDQHLHRLPDHRFMMPASPAAYAQLLYAVLREADCAGKDAILIQMPPDEPPWGAVRDRLLRATQPAAP